MYACAQVPYSEVLSSLNGAVVGLVVDEALPPPPAHSTHIRMLPVLPLAPCVGLAIVRAIDPVARELFLLTPVPPHILSQVTVFVRGAIHLPGIMLLQVWSPPVPLSLLFHRGSPCGPSPFLPYPLPHTLILAADW